MVLFIMLNPSTATQEEDDNTIRRCIGFAQAWGYSRLEVVNLFAFIATDPKDLKVALFPVGIANDTYIMEAVNRASRVIAAWGTHGNFMARDREVIRLLTPHCRIMCLGQTKAGHPKHPLRLRADTQPGYYERLTEG